MKAKSFLRASSLEEAYKLVKESPRNKIVAGGLWLKKGNADVDTLIDLSLLGLEKIEDKKDYVEVGAMVSQRELEKSPLVPEVIREATKAIMGPAFREIATVGGSVYGKYGFSDIITVLLAHHVELVFYPEAVITLDEYVKKPGFYDGILTNIRIFKDKNKAYFKKVEITALDYPILNVAVVKGKEYKVVVGSRPLVAALCENSTKYLNEGGKDFAKAAELAVEELKFGDSIATKSAYRKQLALTYVRRALEEVSK
ncbi:MAG: FAD binding domain-containing protein [Bacilli bacterium]|nr:FAD binding domain-containing protein [Bacilli bacterium]